MSITHNSFQQIYAMMQTIEISVNNINQYNYIDIIKQTYNIIQNCICNMIDPIMLELYNSDRECVDTLNNIKQNLNIIITKFLRYDNTSQFDDIYLTNFKNKTTAVINYCCSKLNQYTIKYFTEQHTINKELKVELCCIAKHENRYIREFVEHYKNIGFDHITIYDNNEDDYDNVYERIKEYVDSGYVTLINIHDKIAYQKLAYIDNYKINYKAYDWIAYFDLDEFLILKQDKSIKDYLKRNCFNNVQLIHINWMMLTDSDKIYYEDKPLIERFNIQSEKAKIKNKQGFCTNMHIKTIVNTSIGYFISFENPHTIIGPYITVNCKGDKIDNSYYTECVYDLAVLNHYHTKTIEEFLTDKYKRGYADCLAVPDIDKLVKRFYSINNETLEKNEYIKQFKESHEEKSI